MLQLISNCDQPLTRSPARTVPAHVAVIMDGNGRWAVGRGLPRSATVVAVLRESHVIVPRGDTVLHAGDEVLVLTTPDAEDDVIVALLG